MATIIGSNQSVERPFEWHSWSVTPDSDELTGTVDIALDTLPQGTVILDCIVAVLVAEAGATTSALDVEVGAADLYDTGADSLGAVGAFKAATAGGVAACNALLLAAATAVSCEITYSGTATTAPTFVVSILCGRVSY